ncbi:MAG: hypothetical protein QM767_25705 [Anaeromyxobacter sp.]
MLRTTVDVLELRCWAEARGARPCRDLASGRLALAFPGQPCAAADVGWDEFEPAFLWTHAVFVYDDAPGATRCFIGPTDDARGFVHGGGAAPPG